MLETVCDPQDLELCSIQDMYGTIVKTYRIVAFEDVYVQEFRTMNNTWIRFGTVASLGTIATGKEKE